MWLRIDLHCECKFCPLLYEKQVTNNSSGKQQGSVGESDVQINCSDGRGLSELEKLLRQKTFTRHVYQHVLEESLLLVVSC